MELLNQLEWCVHCFLPILKKCRGTKDFLVSLSNDKKKWIPVVYDSLPDVSGLSCIQRPLASTFKFKPQSAKFVRFDVMSFYGLGGGLDYFAVGG